jgi:cyclopropane-fatty-acyl-phospholipid synthase
VAQGSSKSIARDASPDVAPHRPWASGGLDPGKQYGQPAPSADPLLGHARAVVELVFGPPGERPFDVRYWSGAIEHGAAAAAPFTIAITRPGSLRRMLLPPNELSIVEAVLSGDVEIDGDAEQAMSLGDEIGRRLASAKVLASLARHLLALPRQDPPLDVVSHRAARTVGEVGNVHAPERDQAAIRYHYDVSNEFYALWLDRGMVYSCAYFAKDDDPDGDLDQAQEAKLDLICRKLRLRPGERLLDVGCGWGALIRHAVRQYGVEAVGITLSEAQAKLARERIAAEGLGDRCRVEIRDYRSLAGLAPFDKISSVGMVEHVGERLLPTYFAALHAALRPGGLLLNHGIVSVSRARPRGRWDWLEHRLWKRDAFIDQYVFPDGRLTAFSAVVASAEGAGFETRDVESLREHYALTLRAWLARLMRNADEAIRLTDERVFRTWRLYMTASAFAFARGRINIVQTLLSRPDEQGRSGLPLRRSRMLDR